MKKFILSLFVVGIFFFGFSNAVQLYDIETTVNCTSVSCSPSSINFGLNQKFTLVKNDNTTSDFLRGNVMDCEGNVSSSVVTIRLSYFGTYDVEGCGFVPQRGGIGSYDIHYKTDKFPMFTYLGNFIDGLHYTVNQIIPYVIYIGIGLLIAILGFYAIRWLVNWIGGKINSYFSSKRD